MSDYYENRKSELTNALAQEWIKRGQAAHHVELADEQIKRIEHRMDEIDRAIQAEKQAAEEVKGKSVEKPTAPDKGKPEIVQPDAPGEAAGTLQGDDTPPADPPKE